MYYDGYKYNEIAEALQEPLVPSKPHSLRCKLKEEIALLIAGSRHRHFTYVI